MNGYFGEKSFLAFLAQPALLQEVLYLEMLLQPKRVRVSIRTLNSTEREQLWKDGNFFPCSKRYLKTHFKYFKMNDCVVFKRRCEK